MRNVIPLALLLIVGCSKAPATHHGTDGGTTGAGGAGGTGGTGGTMEPADGGAPPDGYFAPMQLEVSGHIDDFETAQPLTSPGTMATAALVPPPNVNVSGAMFTLTDVPPFSAFFLVAGSPPDHALTYNMATTIKDQSLSNVAVSTVSQTYLGKLRTGFNVTSQSGTATVLVQVVDAMGKPLANVSGSALKITSGFGKGPFFLDDKLQPAMNALATSASGWIVYFDVPPGTVTITGGTGFTVAAADTPSAADGVSLVQATLTMGTTPGTSTVSFTKDVVPIFINRGCFNCHSGNGTGRRLGGLVLDGNPMKIWIALTQTISPNFNTTRVNLTTPEKSLVLTMPSYENPPDAHPTVVFTSSADPDYQKILSWIRAGAKFN